MRLFLHGRLPSNALLHRLEQAYESQHRYTTLLLSNWNTNKVESEVLGALERYLMHQSSLSVSSQECPSSSSASSSSSSSASSLRDVILHNCVGGERFQNLIVTLMETILHKTDSSLTIRYDKQIQMPTVIAAGLLEGSLSTSPSYTHCRISSLTIKGLTLTPITAKMLAKALPQFVELRELTIRGNLTLFELDRYGASIVARKVTKNASSSSSSMTNKNTIHDEECAVVDAMREALWGVPQLRVLDLQQCHLPDWFLADILEATNPEALVSLRLNGNMAGEEFQQVLFDFLSHPHCTLQDLDLSWQRRPMAKGNLSSMKNLSMLTKALAGSNSSLRTLNLSDNWLNDEDIAYLAYAFRRHANLRSVRLQNCRLSSRAMMVLAHTLPDFSPSLTCLYLDGDHQIDKPGPVQRRLIEGLVKNYYIKELVVPDNCESATLTWILELNRAGRQVLASSPAPKEEHVTTTSNYQTRKVNDENDDPAIISVEGEGENSNDTAVHFASSTDLPDNLWPHVLARADRIARQEYSVDDSSNTTAASVLYLLLREKGYHSILH